MLRGDGEHLAVGDEGGDPLPDRAQAPDEDAVFAGEIEEALEVAIVRVKAWALELGEEAGTEIDWEKVDMKPVNLTPEMALQLIREHERRQAAALKGTGFGPAGAGADGRDQRGGAGGFGEGASGLWGSAAGGDPERTVPATVPRVATAEKAGTVTSDCPFLRVSHECGSSIYLGGVASLTPWPEGREDRPPRLLSSAALFASSG